MTFPRHTNKPVRAHHHKPPPTPLTIRCLPIQEADALLRGRRRNHEMPGDITCTCPNTGTGNLHAVFIALRCNYVFADVCKDRWKIN